MLAGQSWVLFLGDRRGCGFYADCHSVLVGSSSLALWNVVEQQRKARFVGHSVRTF